MQAQIAQEQLVTSTRQCRELEWESQHVREHSQKIEQAHLSALRDAQEKLAAAESARHQAEQDAERLKNSTDRVHADTARLVQELGEVKVSLLCFTAARHG